MNINIIKCESEVCKTAVFLCSEGAKNESRFRKESLIKFVNTLTGIGKFDDSKQLDKLKVLRKN